MLVDHRTFQNPTIADVTKNPNEMVGSCSRSSRSSSNNNSDVSTRIDYYLEEEEDDWNVHHVTFGNSSNDVYSDPTAISTTRRRSRTTTDSILTTIEKERSGVLHSSKNARSTILYPIYSNTGFNHHDKKKEELDRSSLRSPIAERKSRFLNLFSHKRDKNSKRVSSFESEMTSAQKRRSLLSQSDIINQDIARNVVVMSTRSILHNLQSKIEKTACITASSSANSTVASKSFQDERTRNRKSPSSTVMTSSKENAEFYSKGLLLLLRIYKQGNIQMNLAVMSTSTKLSYAKSKAEALDGIAELKEKFS